MLQPAILYLAWRCPETVPEQGTRIFPVGRLIRKPCGEQEAEYEFCYIREAEEARKAGFLPFFGFNEIDGRIDGLINRRWQSPTLFPLFSNRIMSRERPDFGDYARRIALHQIADEAQRLDPLTVLVQSGGRQVTDKFEVFGWPELGRAGYSICFWLRGLRYRPPAMLDVINGLREHQPLEWREKPDTPMDSRAIGIYAGSDEIGFVPRYLLDDFHALKDADATPRIVVDFRNPSNSSLHQRLLCRVEATWPDGFVPFSTERFQPIARRAWSITDEFDPRTLKPRHTTRATDTAA